MKKQLLSFALLLFLMTQTKAQKPVANFNVSKDSICAYDCITFTDSSLNNPTSWLWTFAGALPSTSSDQNPLVCYEDSGRFNVKLAVSNSSGSDSITKTIVVNSWSPVPIITISNDTLFCTIDSSYASYQWYDSTTLIPGATGTFYVDIDTSCSINVCVTGKNGCLICVSMPFIVIVSRSNAGLPCTWGGIQENNPYASAYIFPNPATNQLTIHTSSFHNEAVTVSIMNVLGQEASHPTSLTPTVSPATSGINAGEGEATIDVSKLATGMYFVAVTSEKERWVGRFVKE